MLFYVPVDAAHKIGPLDFFFHLTSRYESRRDIGFDESLEQHRTNWLNRGRLGFTYQSSPESTVRVTYQYSHINTKDEQAAGPRPMAPDFFPTGDWEGRTRQDLYEANITRTWGMSSMTLGRQVVDRDWLVGSNQWGEVARAWTGVYLTNGPCDFFAGRLDLDTIGENRYGTDQHLVFAGHNWGGLGRSTIYYTLNRDGISLYTLGHEWSKTNGKTEFSIKGAWQWGQTFGENHEAWAGMAKVNFGMSDRMNLWASYSTASGGDPSDGTVNTFNDLYPSDHGRLGMMDMVALSNIRAMSFGLGYHLNESMGLSVAYHNFSLFSQDDEWYQTSNTLNNYGSISGNGTSLGSEIDISLHWMLNPNFKLSGGFGIFDPGSAISNAFPASTDNSTFMYVGVGFKY